MTTRKIDLDKVRVALRRLKRGDLLAVAERAIEIVPRTRMRMRQTQRSSRPSRRIQPAWEAGRRRSVPPRVGIGSGLRGALVLFLLSGGCTPCLPDRHCANRCPPCSKAHVAEKPRLSTGVQGFVVQRRTCADMVSLRWQGQTLVVDVHSPRGISGASIQPAREGVRWPAKVVLRLHLRGLEGFDAYTTPPGGPHKMTSKSVFYRGSVRSGTGRGSAELCAVGRSHQKCKPLPRAPVFVTRPQRTPYRQAVVQVELPPALFVHPRARLHLRWIDFYRR